MTSLDHSEETRLNVRLSGPLADHVNRQVDSALYSSHSEYIRDLIRRDLEAEMRANIRSAEEDIAAGRTMPLGTRQDFLAELKANNRAAKKQKI